MKKYILNDPEIINRLESNKIIVVDGGARGELFAPFNKVNSRIIKVLRFDPDPDAQFSNLSEHDMVFHNALWNEKKRISVNIAVEPSASSVYPFNRNLQKYIDPYYDVRKTAKTIELDAISLDELLMEHKDLNIDFIKLDIHGAEFEVLEGAIETLKKTWGLLIESWIIPIHKGQKTRAHVESLAFENQFYVFEENHRSQWIRNKNKFSKAQPVALDTLFFKDPLIDNNATDSLSAIKLTGIANLFDHNAYALQLNEYFFEQGIIDKDLYNFISNFINKNCTNSIKDKFFNKVSKFLGQITDCSFK